MKENRVGQWQTGNNSKKDNRKVEMTILELLKIADSRG